MPAACWFMQARHTRDSLVFSDHLVKEKEVLRNLEDKRDEDERDEDESDDVADYQSACRSARAQPRRSRARSTL